MAQPTVERAARTYNLVIFAIVVACFAAAMVGRLLDPGPDKSMLRLVLRLARLGAPFAALILTAVTTAGVLRQLHRGGAATLNDPQKMAVGFATAKRWASLWLLAAGLFAATGLLRPEPKILDYLIPGLVLVFLIIARPMWGGFEAFVALARQSSD